MSRKVLIVIVSVALVLGVMLIVLANRNTSVAPTQDSNGTESVESSEEMSNGQTTKEITLTAQSFEFIPSTVTVKEGETVRLKIKSIDVTHGFSIPEFNVNSTLKAGEETVVEFVASKKGTFTFFCSVYCGYGHADMQGTLLVE